MAIPRLVRLLHSPSLHVQEMAAEALWDLAKQQDKRQAMVAAGAVPSLVLLLGSKSADIQLSAELTLCIAAGLHL